MARIRSIKPELPSDARLASVPIGARLTFVYLITQADDFGLVMAAPRQMLGLLYPHDDDVSWDTLRGWIDALAYAGIVRWRETTAGIPVVELVNWDRHQRIDNRGRSTLADSLQVVNGEPPRESASRGENPLGEGEGKGKGGGPSPRKAAAKIASYDAEFATAWADYPRKPGDSRNKAAKAYAARRKEGVDPAAILAGVRAYTAHCRRQGTDPKFIKQGATFFGPDRHWESDFGPVESPKHWPYLNADGEEDPDGDIPNPKVFGKAS